MDNQGYFPHKDKAAAEIAARCAQSLTPSAIEYEIVEHPETKRCRIKVLKITPRFRAVPASVVERVKAATGEML